MAPLDPSASDTLFNGHARVKDLPVVLKYAKLMVK